MAEEKTAGNAGMLFNIALNYGGRAEIVEAAQPGDRVRRRARRPRRAALRRLPLHRRPARSRSADPDERRDARQQLPALADRVRRDLGHRHAVAGLPEAAPARGRSSRTRNAIAGTAASTTRRWPDGDATDCASTGRGASDGARPCPMTRSQRARPAPDRRRRGVVPAAVAHARARARRRGARLRRVRRDRGSARRPRAARGLGRRGARRVRGRRRRLRPARRRAHDGRDRDRRARGRRPASPGPPFFATRRRRSCRSSTSACRSARSRPCAPSAAARRCSCSWSTIVVSDSAQYYTGRAFGRRPLSPSISPKKTRRRGDRRPRRSARPRCRSAAALRVSGAPACCCSRSSSATVVGARDRRRSVRVAAQAQRRREGLRRADSRPRRRARSHRQLAVRRAGVLRLRPLAREVLT